MKSHKLSPMRYRPINPKIESNITYTNRVSEKVYLTGQPINKYWTFDFIETISDYINFDDIKTIFDVGSRDGHQSVEFRTWFPEARIVAFEANPNQISLCVNTTKKHNVEIVPKAAGDTNGKTIFFIASNNVGASSLLKNANHPRSNKWPQSKTTVDMVRIDDWCSQNNIDTIDLLWMDVQGAEKIVLDGCGDYLKNVSINSPTIPVLHNVDAISHNDSTEIAECLTKQLHNPVLWVDTVNNLIAQGVTAIVECGPGKVLAGLNRRIDKSVTNYTIDTVDNLNKFIDAINE